MGASFGYLETKHHLSVRVKGNGGQCRNISLDITKSTQFLSSLLMMGPMIKSGLTIHITSENVDGAYIRITRRILEQFGAFVVLDGSDYHVPSNSTFQCPTYAIIKTYDDHRFAMAFTLLGLKADGITIDDPLCCRKTFENYFEVLDELLLYMKC